MTDNSIDDTERPPTGTECPHCGGTIEKETHEFGHDWVCQWCGMNVAGSMEVRSEDTGNEQ